MAHVPVLAIPENVDLLEKSLEVLYIRQDPQVNQLDELTISSVPQVSNPVPSRVLPPHSLSPFGTVTPSLESQAHSPVCNTSCMPAT